MLSLRHQLQERSEEVSLLAEDCVTKDERIQELERAVSVVAQAVLPLQQQQQQQQPPLPPGPPPSGTPTAAPGAAATTLPPPPRLPALPSTPTASNGKAPRRSVGPPPPPPADAHLGHLPAAPPLSSPPQQNSLSASGEDIAGMRLVLRAINQ